MNTDFKRKWVAALRSGDYDQCEGQLRELDQDDGSVVGYCCLGVGSDVANPAGWGEYFENEDEALSVYVMGVAELSDEDPTVVVVCSACNGTGCAECEYGFMHRTLSDLNDSGYSFEHIAGLIDAQL